MIRPTPRASACTYVMTYSCDAAGSGNLYTYCRDSRASVRTRRCGQDRGSVPPEVGPTTHRGAWPATRPERRAAPSGPNADPEGRQPGCLRECRGGGLGEGERPREATSAGRSRRPQPRDAGSWCDAGSGPDLDRVALPGTQTGEVNLGPARTLIVRRDRCLASPGERSRPDGHCPGRGADDLTDGAREDFGGRGACDDQGRGLPRKLGLVIVAPSQSLGRVARQDTRRRYGPESRETRAVRRERVSPGRYWDCCPAERPLVSSIG